MTSVTECQKRFKMLKLSQVNIKWGQRFTMPSKGVGTARPVHLFPPGTLCFVCSLAVFLVFGFMCAAHYFVCSLT